MRPWNARWAQRPSQTAEVFLAAFCFLLNGFLLYCIFVCVLRAALWAVASPKHQCTQKNVHTCLHCVYVVLCAEPPSQRAPGRAPTAAAQLSAGWRVRWAWLCTASGSASGSQDGWTACSSSWSSGPWALLIKAMTLRLRSRGNVPSSILGGAPPSPKAHQPCPRDPGSGLP